MEPTAHLAAGAAKEQLRGPLLAARRARSPQDLHDARTAIRRVVLARCREARWRRVAAYVALRTEPGSDELLADLVGDGIEVLVPRTLPDRDLDWTAWTPAGVGDALGREAVAGVQAVLVPALAVAEDGTRLGRGGGSYDRALSRCAPGTPAIALLFDGETRARLPREPWDRPVTEVVTPAGLRELGPPG